MSAASAVAAEIYARATSVTTANGFATNVGARTFRGKRRIAEDDLPCLLVFEGKDKVDDQQGIHVKVGQRFILEGHDYCDADNPNDKGHEIIADLKRAIFSGDITFGRTIRALSYKARTLGAREDGLAATFASIEIEVLFSENLTVP